MKSYLNNDSQTKLKQTVILLLGNNFFVKNNFEEALTPEFEIINLAHIPSIAQIEDLTPDLIIINLDGKREIYADEFLQLAKEIKHKFQSNLPIICITDKTTQKNLKPQLNKNLFHKIWKTETSTKAVLDDLKELSNNISTKKKLSAAIFEFEKYKKNIAKEYKEASIFQDALFKQAIPSTNLKAACRYHFAKDISGDYFKIFNLSKSHVGILIGEVNGENAASSLLTGFLQGELASLAAFNSRLLWSPSAFLSRLSDMIFTYSKISGLSSSAWYGVIDLTNGQLTYARAGHPIPLCYSKNNSPSTSFLEGGSGFPLGLFENMKYKDFYQELDFGSRLLLYTGGLLPSRKEQKLELHQCNWLDTQFSKICAEQKSIEGLPKALEDALEKGLEQKESNLSTNPQNSYELSILVCAVESGNQAFVTIPTESETDSLNLQNKKNLLSDFSLQDLNSTKQLICTSCAPKLSSEAAYEINLALNELFRVAKKQVSKGQEIAKLLEKTKTPSGFLVTWWIHETSLDISIRLESGAIPWRYNSGSQDPDIHKLDAGTELNLFFDEICVNTDGYELSMNKKF